VEDLQRPPTDDDRTALTERITQAYAAGRIGEADRDIRLGNVRSAQSMTELHLMSRDLDQLDATLGTSVPADPTAAGPYATFDPEDTGGPGSVSAPRRTVVVLVAVVALLVVVGAAAAALVALAGSDSTSGGTTASPGSQSGVPASPEESEVGTEPEPAGAPYSLTARGVSAFLRSYAQRFGTTRVVDLTLYEKYAIVGVPVPGKARQEGWLFRDGTWTAFGGVRATIPGSRVVDTRRLAVPAVMRNVARAKATLGVEAPAQAYVIVRFIRPPDQQPRVDIHVSNEFRESGYLATALPGTVVRAFPYTR
jgi:hypothetical protein